MVPLQITRTQVVLPGIIASAVAIIFINYLYGKLMAERVGKDLMRDKKMGGKLDFLALQIQDGAKAFLQEEYKWLGYFVFFMAAILLILFSVAPSAGADSTQVRTVTENNILKTRADVHGINPQRPASTALHDT